MVHDLAEIFILRESDLLIDVEGGEDGLERFDGFLGFDSSACQNERDENIDH